MIQRLFLLLYLLLAAAPVQAATYLAVADRDAHLRANQGNTNYGTATTLEINTGGNQRRAVVHFTLPTIPPGEIITAATIRLWVTAQSNDVISLHRVTDTWAEATVTWANTSADFDTTAQTSAVANATGAYLTFTVTSLVSNWVSGAAANNGVMLIGNAGTNTTLAARESATVSQRPQLTITTAAIPPLTVVKSSQAKSDPYNGNTNPKLVPGAFVAYTVGVSNSGTYTVSNNSVAVTDATPPGMRLFVGNISGGVGPVLFTGPASALTYTFTILASTTDDADFSNDGGVTWTYTPVPDAWQVDANVTNVRVRPKGSMAASSSFSLLLNYQVQ